MSFSRKLSTVVVILFAFFVALFIAEPYWNLGVLVLFGGVAIPLLYIYTLKNEVSFRKWIFIGLLDVLACGFAFLVVFVASLICFSVCPSDAIIWVSGAVVSALASVGSAVFFTMRIGFILSFLKSVAVTAIVLIPFVVYGISWIGSFIN